MNMQALKMLTMILAMTVVSLSGTLASYQGNSLLAETSGSTETVKQLSDEVTKHMGVDSIVRDLISMLGPMGVLAWYLWYKTAKGDPAKDAAYEKQLQTDREAFQTEMRLEREAHHAVIDKLVKEIADGRESLMEVVRSCPNVANHIR